MFLQAPQRAHPPSLQISREDFFGVIHSLWITLWITMLITCKGCLYATWL
jgi:hypothetical protein